MPGIGYHCLQCLGCKEWLAHAVRINSHNILALSTYSELL